jgi:hypothetical protein
MKIKEINRFTARMFSKAFATSSVYPNDSPGPLLNS